MGAVGERATGKEIKLNPIPLFYTQERPPSPLLQSTINYLNITQTLPIESTTLLILFLIIKWPTHNRFKQ